MRTLPDAKLDAPAVARASRLVITGGNHHRLHEELTEAGGYLRDAGFKREDGVTKLRDWLDSSAPGTIADSLFDALRTRFKKHTRGHPERRRHALEGPPQGCSAARLRPASAKRSTT